LPVPEEKEGMALLVLHPSWIYQYYKDLVLNVYAISKTLIEGVEWTMLLKSLPENLSSLPGFSIHPGPPKKGIMALLLLETGN
jgi:hypothetical protein